MLSLDRDYNLTSNLRGKKDFNKVRIKNILSVIFCLVTCELEQKGRVFWIFLRQARQTIKLVQRADVLPKNVNKTKIKDR